MDKKWGVSLLFLFMFVILFLMCLGMQHFSTRLNALEEDIVVLKEDLQIQRDVFSSYLNGTLSQDMGGE